MGTVSKALSLLENFNQNRTEIGLSEMARLSGMNKATTHRLLSELQAHGFVEQLGDERTYRLGTEILRLAKLREAAVPLMTASRAVLKRLSESTHETAHVSVVRGTTLNSLGHAYSSRHATRVMMDDAETLTFHGTSSGLAILAFSSPEFVDEILGAPLVRHTTATQTDPETIRAALARVRETGVAVSIGGFEADVHSHSSPIFDARGVAIGAIAVAAPESRVTPERAKVIRQAVVAAAAELTAEIGGSVPDSFPQAAAA